MALLPAATPPPVQKRDAQHMFLQHRGARADGIRLYFLVNLFLTNLVSISGFSSLFLAIAVLSAYFPTEC